VSTPLVKILLKLLRKYIAQWRFKFVVKSIFMSTEYTPPKSKQLYKHLQEIIASEKITPETFERLEEHEHAELTKLLKHKMEIANNEYQRLAIIMGAALQLSGNRIAWESNHQKITQAIYTTLSANGQMPTQTYIAQITGLSRQTVNKHLSEGEDASVYTEHIRSFSAMAPHVLTRIVKAATSRDNSVPAMRLYFELLEKFQGKGQLPVPGLQHNYIQINNTIIKQEALQQINPEQLKQIEEMLQRNLPVADAENGE
jgi:hypothetical protein